MARRARPMRRRAGPTSRRLRVDLASEVDAHGMDQLLTHLGGRCACARNSSLVFGSGT
jgi:hypothetical protein